MTFELNIRAINHQTDKLQRDVETLVRSTAEDREFREKHEERLKKLWQEMLAIKQHMTRVGDEQRDTAGIQTDLEKCRTEASAVIDEFRNEIGGLKTLMDGISKQMGQLPTTNDTPESGYSSQRQNSLNLEQLKPTQHISRQDSVNTEDDLEQSFRAVSEELASQGHESSVVTAASRRIIEIIESTKRWHHEHKTTNLSDGQFSANYLNKQSKRDAKLAAYIQRKIKLRIRKRQRSTSTPKTLEEFCKDVKWEDVIATVQESLVKGKKTAILAIV
jgi:chromosome segregation ATPase